MKKLLIVVGVASLVFFVAKNPGAAAVAAKSFGGEVAKMGAGFGDFFARLVS